MNEDKFPYEKMIFVCVNDRKQERPSCGDQQGEKIFEELRRLAKEREVHPRIRVSQAKCLGQCSKGANIMIYPDQVWLNAVNLNDVEKIARKYF